MHNSLCNYLTNKKTLFHIFNFFSFLENCSCMLHIFKLILNFSFTFLLSWLHINAYSFLQCKIFSGVYIYIFSLLYINTHSGTCLLWPPLGPSKVVTLWKWFGYITGQLAYYFIGAKATKFCKNGHFRKFHCILLILHKENAVDN